MLLRSDSVRGVVLAALAAGSCAVAAASGSQPTSFEYLGELALPPGTMFLSEPVGGLSGLVWDPAGDRFLVLSDDRGERAPSRFYALRLDFSALASAGGVELLDRTRLTGDDGRGYGVGRVDPEGFARASDGALFLSSEGVARDGIAPFVARLGAEGRELGRFELPDRFLPDGRGGMGVRDNLGFESLTVTPDDRFLVAGLENALAGDGPAADVGTPSPSRIVSWELAAPNAAPREHHYEVAPVASSPRRANGLRVNGLVDLLALSDRRLLALEREFVQGVGLRVALYLVQLDPPLSRSSVGQTGNSRSELLVDFADLGAPLANFEGIAFGPRLPDGRRSFVVVSDDNFDPLTGATRFLVFAVDEEPVTIARIQGASHRSPLEGLWVVGVEAVVTAVDGRARVPAFFVESPVPDGDPATSEGLRVEWPGAGRLAVGERVRMHGRIVEREPGRKQLTVTTLVAGFVEGVEGETALPPPPVLGDRRRVPEQIDDDGLTLFDPADDAIDWWESLEGMRVVADGRRVTGPTRDFGEMSLAFASANGPARSAAGGDLLTADGPRLDRFIVAGRLVGGLPELAVGSRLARPVEGVVDYSFSNYKLLATHPLEVETRSTACDGGSGLRPDARRVRVATFNVENLSAAETGDRLERIARAIVERLGSPEVVALEEVQDDSGTAAGDGVVSAAGTLDRLVRAIAAAGGPRYDWAQIDPELDREGGVPGGNIRVVLLYAPSRASLPRRGEPGPHAAATVVTGEDGVRIEPNPARVAPLSPAFTLSGGEGVRRSLAVELRVDGAPWFFVVNHWSSKYDDSRAFGAEQPPRRPTGAKRLAQAETIHEFASDLLSAAPDARVVVLGDLNDVPWSPPIQRIARPPLIGLTDEVPAASRYSYNFEGSAQLIDYVLVSPALAAGAAVEIVHLNSDCPESSRVSDHDAVVAAFRAGD